MQRRPERYTVEDTAVRNQASTVYEELTLCYTKMFCVIIRLFIFSMATSGIERELNKDLTFADALNMIKTLNLLRKEMEHHNSSKNGDLKL